MKLDLGCGSSPREGYIGVDCVKAEVTLDLCDGARWPWDDCSIEELYSSHFIEHIPNDEVWSDLKKQRQDALFFFFDEAFRIIQPGGLFLLRWPSLQSVGAFQDPTHRRFIPIETLDYLHKRGREFLRVNYRVDCNWVPVKIEEPAPTNDWRIFREVTAVLRADK